MAWALDITSHGFNCTVSSPVITTPKFGDGSQGAIGEVFPFTESHPRSDVELGMLENAPTDKYASVSYHYTPY